MSAPIFINETQVLSILNWELLNNAVEEALKSVCNSYQDVNFKNENVVFADQPARTMVKIEDNGILFTMPGFIGNYQAGMKKFNTLGCKLVTCFKGNESRNPALPNIIANILLFDNITGKLKCVMEATEITGYRTASASIVATKYLYFKRHEKLDKKPIVSVIGCGVQGRTHSLGFLHTFDIAELRLFNRNVEKSKKLVEELEKSKHLFKNKNVKLIVKDSIEECCRLSDILITATFSSEPLIKFEWLKPGIMICAVGAGPGNHHSELSAETYLKSSIYVDTLIGAKSELKTLNAEIRGEVGDIILNYKKIPDKSEIIIFQSMGMAVEDATVAQAVYEKFLEIN